MSERIEVIRLDKIDTSSTQTREHLCPSAVDDYAAILRDRGTLDPLVVFREGDTNWLSCGFHRLQAHRQAGRKSVKCEVRQGTKADAIRFGIADNLRHRGVRLTRADKGHNVRLAIREGLFASDREIAEHCGVSPTTVGNHRRCLAEGVQIGQSRPRTGDDQGEYRYEPVEAGDADASSAPDAEHEDSAPPQDASEGHDEPAAARATVSVPAPERDPKLFLKACFGHLGRLKGEILHHQHKAVRLSTRILTRIEEINDVLEDWRDHFGDDEYLELAA